MDKIFLEKATSPGRNEGAPTGAILYIHLKVYEYQGAVKFKKPSKKCVAKITTTIKIASKIILGISLHNCRVLLANVGLCRVVSGCVGFLFIFFSFGYQCVTAFLLCFLCFPCFLGADNQ